MTHVAAVLLAFVAIASAGEGLTASGIGKNETPTPTPTWTPEVTIDFWKSVDFAKPASVKAGTVVSVAVQALTTAVAWQGTHEGVDGLFAAVQANSRNSNNDYYIISVLNTTRQDVGPPKVASLGDFDGFVVMWQEGGKLTGKVYLEAGVSVKELGKVNDTAADAAYVQALPDGGAVAGTLHKTGRRKQAAVEVVNATGVVVGPPKDLALAPLVENGFGLQGLAKDGFVVTWQNSGVAYAQLYHTNCTARQASIRIGKVAGAEAVRLAGLADGGFVAAFPKGDGEFEVDVYTGDGEQRGHQTVAAPVWGGLAALGNDQFVVTVGDGNLTYTSRVYDFTGGLLSDAIDLGSFASPPQFAGTPFNPGAYGFATAWASEDGISGSLFYVKHLPTPAPTPTPMPTPTPTASTPTVTPTNSTVSPTPTGGDGKSSSHTVAIVLGVVGGVIVLGVAAFLIKRCLAARSERASYPSLVNEYN